MGHAALGRTIYCGTLIHSVSLTDLDVLERSIIGVGEDGLVKFIERDVRLEDVTKLVKQKYGWVGINVVRGDGTGRGFWFPGFVGKFI